MKIMVFAVPAVKDGALTILNQFYEYAKNNKNDEWLFIVSLPKLKEVDNVSIINFPWIKKTWFHRLYFDVFRANKLVKKYKPNKIISLQNTIIFNAKKEQVLYLHQSLPFAEKRFKINENIRFWIYQNIISKIIFFSIKKADRVIVQTKWIRDAAVKKTGSSINKFDVIEPNIDIIIKNKYHRNNSDDEIFFYPASGFSYKNHEIIVKACLLLKSYGISNYRVIFTLSEKENQLISKLFQTIKKEELPIEFVGRIRQEEVFQYFSQSVLVFPSYIESFGLPLLEAKMHNTPILASDCAFSREILNDYDRVKYFSPFDEYDLAELLMKTLNKNLIC